jgi:prepilin-type processing-associated H-X9-DG protein
MRAREWRGRDCGPEVLKPGWGNSGFTLVELVVVIGMLTLLAWMLVPALAKTNVGSPTVRCVNNLRQLQQAAAMYASDNNGRLAPNGSTLTFNASAWASGYLDWAQSTANTNLHYLSGAALGPYTTSDRRIYKCPADKAPASNGSRVRSYSMNGFVGGTVEQEFFGYATYRAFLKEADFAVSGSAKTFVFVDEHPDSINDEVLGLQMTPSTLWPGAVPWDDVPASHHNGSGAFSFADGHAEIHAWRDSLTKAPVLKTSTCSAYGKTSVNDNRWLSAHATAPK